MINIVQFGANSGNDHVTKLINEKIIPSGKEFHLYLVEPITQCIEELIQCYKHVKNVTLEASAVIPTPNLVDENGRVNVYYGKGTNYAVSSVYKEHVEKTSTVENEKGSIEKSQVEKIRVKGYTPTQLFEKWDIKTIDYLFLDIEGLDNEIVQNIKHRSVDINFICWEHSHHYGGGTVLRSYENLWEWKYAIERTGNESYAYKRTKNESYISDIRQWLQ